MGAVGRRREDGFAAPSPPPLRPPPACQGVVLELVGSPAVPPQVVQLDGGGSSLLQRTMAAPTPTPTPTPTIPTISRLRPPGLSACRAAPVAKHLKKWWPKLLICYYVVWLVLVGCGSLPHPIDLLFLIHFHARRWCLLCFTLILCYICVSCFLT
ncbi:hypothetical protein BS78_03G385200 [Paspalum vaginatum]|nr:hypothetical protein BS78_03G385200 [Paspalum vaginatum]